MWPIKNGEKYFMAHQYMPQIFHDLTKTLRPSSYMLNARSLIYKRFLCSKMAPELLEVVEIYDFT